MKIQFTVKSPRGEILIFVVQGVATIWMIGKKMETTKKIAELLKL